MQRDAMQGEREMTMISIYDEENSLKALNTNDCTCTSL